MYQSPSESFFIFLSALIVSVLFIVQPISPVSERLALHTICQSFVFGHYFHFVVFSVLWVVVFHAQYICYTAWQDPVAIQECLYKMKQTVGSGAFQSRIWPSSCGICFVGLDEWEIVADIHMCYLRHYLEYIEYRQCIISYIICKLPITQNYIKLTFKY